MHNHKRNRDKCAEKVSPPPPPQSTSFVATLLGVIHHMQGMECYHSGVPAGAVECYMCKHYQVDGDIKSQITCAINLALRFGFLQEKQCRYRLVHALASIYMARGIQEKHEEQSYAQYLFKTVYKGCPPCPPICEDSCRLLIRRKRSRSSPCHSYSRKSSRSSGCRPRPSKKCKKKPQKKTKRSCRKCSPSPSSESESLESDDDCPSPQQKKCRKKTPCKQPPKKRKTQRRRRSKSCSNEKQTNRPSRGGKKCPCPYERKRGRRKNCSCSYDKKLILF